MTTEDHMTPEEEAYSRLIEEKGEVFSIAAQTVLSEAQWVAYALHLVSNYAFQPQEYEEAMQKMRLAANELTNHDGELLVKLWRAALAAGASIDPDDRTPIGWRVCKGDLHPYYRMLSSMIEDTLQEKEIAELREKTAKMKPEELWDVPF